MTLQRFRIFAAAATLLASGPTAVAAPRADFNEVGKQMAMMLQNSHFSRAPYNAELGRKFLEEYFRRLDSQRLYFNAQDLEEFRVRYADRLHTLLLQGNSVPAATEIYRTFERRVESRIARAEAALAAGNFDFSGEETVMLSRKDAPWPADEAEATRIWDLHVKEAVLAEVLRRETVSRLAQEQGKPDPSAKDLSPIEKVSLRYKRILSSVKDVDDEEISNLFLSAVAGTYDPHTDYMSAREMSRFKDSMKNELVGIGALLAADEDGGATKIMGIVVGGPADREGTLKLNDRVMAVDVLDSGKPEDMVDIMFMKIDKVVELIRGKEGTTVALKVEPAAGPPGETRIIRIQRGKVEMKDEQASAEWIQIRQPEGPARRLGVISLPSFYADFDEGKVRCSVDVERLLLRLMEEGIDGLVLDLRNNGGGSLEEVRRMTGFFIQRGPVVQVKNALNQVQVKDTENGRPIYEGPMVVVTDRTSASASEILAGALQDFNRAVVVGESSTFGKGTVQQPMDIGRMLPLFSARDRAGHLKVTIQKFYRPSGSSTQRDGVVPQIIVPSLLDAMEIGEAFQPNALPHERIRPAPDFRPLDAQLLFLPQLKELSQKRIKECQDFGYVIEDVLKARERIQRNELSLNKEKRLAEIAEADARNKSRNAERRERFEQIAAKDKESYLFHKLSLDDLEKDAPLAVWDPSAEDKDYMRLAKDETRELDETPEWPSKLDPLKRESLAVLKDLVDLTEKARVAGVQPGRAP